jgi:hypothetical protein
MALVSHRQRMATHCWLHDGHADKVVLIITAASVGEKPDTRPHLAGKASHEPLIWFCLEKQRTASVICHAAKANQQPIVSEGGKMDMMRTFVQGQITGFAATLQTRLCSTSMAAAVVRRDLCIS